MVYTLPTEKSGVSKKWVDQKFLCLGAAGIGKSEIWSHAKNPLYIEAEAGLNFIDACKMPVRSWEDVHGTIGALLKAKDDFPYDVVIVDTIDRILVCIEDEVMGWARKKYEKGNEYQGVGDIPEGAGWYRREAMINKFLKAIEVLPCAKVLIGHLADKEVKVQGAKGYHKSTINIGGKIGANILAWSDHTLNITGQMMGDELKRVVYTKPTMSREAKSRGNMVQNGWRWGNDSKDNFDKLREQFD